MTTQPPNLIRLELIADSISGQDKPRKHGCNRRQRRRHTATLKLFGAKRGGAVSP